MDEVKVSVVTVSYNARDSIEETIQSVIHQTYSNIEYIVIDGASTDGTVEILNIFKPHISICVSEPDSGIYDAMNKAIELATGEWIIFMNAGDLFASNDVVKNIFSQINSDEYDFIYGQHFWNNGKTKAVVPNRPLDLMWQRICFSHQSLFSRTSLMKERPYDLSYKVVSDYENYFHYYSVGKRFKQVSFPVSVFLAGGHSDVHFLTRTLERWSVVRKYKKDSYSWHMYYVRLIAEHYIKILKSKLHG